MAITWEKALGIHQHAVNVRAQRSEVLSSNIINADTPNYKARDVDFRSILKNVSHAGAGQLATTNAKHIGSRTQVGLGSSDLLYRVPQQASLDGNTVDSHVEHMKFSENAIRYQASVSFLSGRIKGIMNVLRQSGGV